MASADLGDEETDAVLEVLRSGRLSMGQKTERFEQITAEYCGARYAIALNSGTAGLHVLCVAAGIKPGDEVITPSFSFVASTNCVLYLGARPVFVDIEPKTYCIDPSQIEAVVTNKTKAIIAVDVFGHPAEWDRILEIADRRGLKVIADACESLGAEYRGSKTGPFGIGGAFAYFPNKQITTGEGGMVVTNDEQVFRLCRSLRNQGRDESDTWLGHARMGYNYRMDELSSALGLAQMQKIDQLLARRRHVAEMYTLLLSDESRVRTPQQAAHARMSHFVYVIELQGEYERQSVMKLLAERGIQSRGYFAPIHQQDYVRGLLSPSQPSLPVTERVATKTIALPFHNKLSEGEVRRVIEELKGVLDTLTPL